MDMKILHQTFLYTALALSFIFLAVVISPFLTTIILAAILVIGTYPIYDAILALVRGKRRVAAFILSTSIGIVFSGIVFVFFLLLSDEAISTYQDFETWISVSQLNLNHVFDYVKNYIDIPTIDLASSIIKAAQAFSSTLVAQSTNFLKSIVWFLGNFLLLVFTMYFFFKDGKRIVLFVEKIIPLQRKNSREILNRFKQVSLAMLYGIFLTAIAQGFLGGIGLAAAGIRNPIFWGTVMAFFGMLPIGGTAIVWLPAGIFLIANGRVFAGIALLIWGTCIVAVVDNLIKPLVIARQTNTYPLVTFLVVIGGLFLFGIKGAIIAPMVLAVFVSLSHIYEREQAEQE